MIDKINAFFYMMYLKADLAVKKMKSEEDGMETIQAVILVAIAVIIALMLVEFLTRGNFGDGQTDNKGLIGYVFYKLKGKLDTIFDPE